MLCIHVSIISERVGNIEIGLYLFRSSFDPALKIEFTFACFHIPGNIPDDKILLIMYVIPGVTTFGAIFNNLGLIESNPVAFATSILDR